MLIKYLIRQIKIVQQQRLKTRIETIQNSEKSPRNKMMQLLNNSNFLTINRLRIGFQSVRYTQRDYITAIVLRQILTKLANEQFDEDIFNQLWEQCKLSSQGQAKISNFIDVIIRAETILIKKESQCTIKIKDLQTKLYSNNISSSDKVQISRQLNQLNELKTGFNSDLQVIKKPFLKFPDETIIKKNQQIHSTKQNEPTIYRQRNRIEQQPQVELFEPTSKKTQALQWLCYNAWICLFTQIIIYLYINVFMNSVLSVLIITIFLFEQIDRKTVRFLFWFTIFTLVVDVFWYFIQAKNVWSPGDTGIQPYFLNKYLKLVVILYSFQFFMKIMSVFLLWSQYNIDQSEPRQVNICGSKFILRAENSAPLQKLFLQFDRILTKTNTMPRSNSIDYSEY